MKVLAAICLSFLLCRCNGGAGGEPAAKTEVADGVSLSSFKVWGNCGMCQRTIEGALKVDGINKASWSSKTKLLQVSYDSTVITLDQIHKRIAAVGYDTQVYQGSDSAYAGLHECCKYERK